MSQEIQALHFFQTHAERLGTFEDCRLTARLCKVWEHDCGWGQIQHTLVGLRDGQSAWSYCLWWMEYT